jgi:hypothetical protein
MAIKHIILYCLWKHVYLLLQSFQSVSPNLIMTDHDTENNEQIMTNNSIIYLLFLYHIEHSLAFREPNIYSLYHGNNYVQHGFLVAWAVLFQRLRLDNLEEPMNKIRALLKILVPEQDQDRWYKGASSVLYTYALVSNRHLHMRYRTEFVYHD